MSSADHAPPLALVDLGDTLCDASAAVDAALRAVGTDPSHATESQRQAVTRIPDFWRTLAPLTMGFDLLELLRREGFRVTIVTKGPRQAPHVWADKAAWCREHAPDVPLIVADDKALIYGEVLVDDWPPYLHSWQARWPEGLAIVVPKPWNLLAPLGPQLIRYDPHDRDALLRVLRARTAARQAR